MRRSQSATAFCTERGINPKYFSLRKSRLKSPPHTKPKSENFLWGIADGVVLLHLDMPSRADVAIQRLLPHQIRCFTA